MSRLTSLLSMVHFTVSYSMISLININLKKDWSKYRAWGKSMFKYSMARTESIDRDKLFNMVLTWLLSSVLHKIVSCSETAIHLFTICY